MESCYFCSSDKQQNLEINDSHKDMLQIIIPELEPNIYQNSNICAACNNLVQNIFNFKSTFLELEDNIINYKTEEYSKIYLEKIIGLTDSGNCKGRICRTCFDIIEDELFVEINSNSNLLRKYQEMCLSELNLSLTIEPVVCLTCVDMLQQYFNFLCKCKNLNKNIFNEPVCQTLSVNTTSNAFYNKSSDRKGYTHQYKDVYTTEKNNNMNSDYSNTSNKSNFTNILHGQKADSKIKVQPEIKYSSIVIQEPHTDNSNRNLPSSRAPRSVKRKAPESAKRKHPRSVKSRKVPSRKCVKSNNHVPENSNDSKNSSINKDTGVVDSLITAEISHPININNDGGPSINNDFNSISNDFKIIDVFHVEEEISSETTNTEHPLLIQINQNLEENADNDLKENNCSIQDSKTLTYSPPDATTIQEAPILEDRSCNPVNNFITKIDEKSKSENDTTSSALIAIKSAEVCEELSDNDAYEDYYLESSSATDSPYNLTHMLKDEKMENNEDNETKSTIEMSSLQENWLNNEKPELQPKELNVENVEIKQVEVDNETKSIEEGPTNTETIELQPKETDIEQPIETELQHKETHIEQNRVDTDNLKLQDGVINNTDQKTLESLTVTNSASSVDKPTENGCSTKNLPDLPLSTSNDCTNDDLGNFSDNVEEVSIASNDYVSDGGSISSTEEVTTRKNKKKRKYSSASTDNSTGDPDFNPVGVSDDSDSDGYYYTELGTSRSKRKGYKCKYCNFWETSKRPVDVHELTCKNQSTTLQEIIDLQVSQQPKTSNVLHIVNPSNCISQSPADNDIIIEIVDSETVGVPHQSPSNQSSTIGTLKKLAKHLPTSIQTISESNISKEISKSKTDSEPKRTRKVRTSKKSDKAKSNHIQTSTGTPSSGIIIPSDLSITPTGSIVTTFANNSNMQMAFLQENTVGPNKVWSVPTSLFIAPNTSSYVKVGETWVPTISNNLPEYAPNSRCPQTPNSTAPIGSPQWTNLSSAPNSHFPQTPNSTTPIGSPHWTNLSSAPNNRFPQTPNSVVLIRSPHWTNLTSTPNSLLPQTTNSATLIGSPHWTNLSSAPNSCFPQTPNSTVPIGSPDWTNLTSAPNSHFSQTPNFTVPVGSLNCNTLTSSSNAPGNNLSHVPTSSSVLVEKIFVDSSAATTDGIFLSETQPDSDPLSDTSLVPSNPILIDLLKNIPKHSSSNDPLNLNNGPKNLARDCDKIEVTKDGISNLVSASTRISQEEGITSNLDKNNVQVVDNDIDAVMLDLEKTLETSSSKNNSTVLHNSVLNVTKQTETGTKDDPCVVENSSSDDSNDNFDDHVEDNQTLPENLQLEDNICRNKSISEDKTAPSAKDANTIEIDSEVNTQSSISSLLPEVAQDSLLAKLLRHQVPRHNSTSSQAEVTIVIEDSEDTVNICNKKSNPVASVEGSENITLRRLLGHVNNNIQLKRKHINYSMKKNDGQKTRFGCTKSKPRNKLTPRKNLPKKPINYSKKNDDQKTGVGSSSSILENRLTTKKIQQEKSRKDVHLVNVGSDVSVTIEIVSEDDDDHNRDVIESNKSDSDIDTSSLTEKSQNERHPNKGVSEKVNLISNVSLSSFAEVTSPTFTENVMISEKRSNTALFKDSESGGLNMNKGIQSGDNVNPIKNSDASQTAQNLTLGAEDTTKAKECEISQALISSNSSKVCHRTVTSTTTTDEDYNSSSPSTGSNTEITKKSEVNLLFKNRPIKPSGLKTLAKQNVENLVLNNHRINPYELAIFKCDWCPFNTRHFQLINVHILTHLNNFLKDTQYACPCCPLFFTQKQLFLLHFQNNHERYGYKLVFWCVSCTSSFPKKAKFREHSKVCSKNVAVKLFKCNSVVYCMQCTYETTDVTKAKIHIRSCKSKQGLGVVNASQVIELD